MTGSVPRRFADTRAAIDFDDADGLIAADRDGLLRAASMAGAQVRATAAAVDEGALALVVGDRPRSVVWVAGRGPAQSAGELLSAALGSSAGEPIVLAAEAPPWIGPLDVMVVAGDDAGDPALTAAVASGVRRGARVVVVAPFEGPLRDAMAGRASILAPRVWVPDEFGLHRYLAAGLATFGAVDASLGVDLGALADQLDAETLRNSTTRELFTNPAKALADRIDQHQVVFSGDCPATLALARHVSTTLLRVALQGSTAVGLADVLVAVRSGLRDSLGGSAMSYEDALFHDEQIDGPLASRLRVLVLALAAERDSLVPRLAGMDGVDLLGVQDVPESDGTIQAIREVSSAAAAGRPEQQLSLLALRLEMAAVYSRLARG
ncbi:MAG: TobH protein [Mycobacterium sp.]